MNNIAKCCNFEVLFFDNLRESSESVTSSRGFVYVGDGLRFVCECVYIVNSS